MQIDHVCEVVGEIHLFDWADAKVARRQVRRKLCCQGSDVRHALWIRVYGEDFAAFAEEMDEVSSVAAASVEDAHPGRDISSQDLVEDVDIDLTELLLTFIATSVASLYSPSMPFLLVHIISPANYLSAIKGAQPFSHARLPNERSFQPTDNPSSFPSIVAWWELRRIAFNVLVGAVGSFESYRVSMALGTYLEKPGDDGDFTPLLSVFAFGTAANFFYTSGLASGRDLFDCSETWLAEHRTPTFQAWS